MTDVFAQHQEGTWTVVALTGAIDLEAAPVVRSTLGDLEQAGRRNVIAELSGVELIDSVGLGVLTSALKRARQGGGDLRLAAPPSNVARVLSVTRLDRIFVVADTVEATAAAPAAAAG